jgi:hypothetical protein
MTTSTPTRLESNGQSRKTLASQLDRLEGILQVLDGALAGAVQVAVEQAVKQAAQTVLTEVLTNRQLHEELQRGSQLPPPPEERSGKPSLTNRIWRATTESIMRTVHTVQRWGRSAGMDLVAAGGMVAGVVYAVRGKIVSMAKTAYRYRKRLVQGGIATLRAAGKNDRKPQKTGHFRHFVRTL